MATPTKPTARHEKKEPSSPVLASPPVLRDDKYYFEEGDCVIQVQTVLFRVSSGLCILQITWL